MIARNPLVGSYAVERLIVLEGHTLRLPTPCSLVSTCMQCQSGVLHAVNSTEALDEVGLCFADINAFSSQIGLSASRHEWWKLQPRKQSRKLNKVVSRGSFLQSNEDIVSNNNAGQGQRERFETMTWEQIWLCRGKATILLQGKSNPYPRRRVVGQYWSMKPGEQGKEFWENCRRAYHQGRFHLISAIPSILRGLRLIQNNVIKADIKEIKRLASMRLSSKYAGAIEF